MSLIGGVVLLKTWVKEDTAPILKRFYAVRIVQEEENVLVARPISYSLQNTDEIDLDTIISIYGVDSEREALRISTLFNKMISKKIKVTLLSIVDAVNILEDN